VAAVRSRRTRSTWTFGAHTDIFNNISVKFQALRAQIDRYGFMDIRDK